MASGSEAQIPALRSPDRTRDFLASTELFGDLSRDAADEILDRAEWVHLSGGETLFRQGDAGDAMYLVVSGRVQVIVEKPQGSDEVVQELGRGENLGELALLTDDPRSATIRAVRDTELLRLRRSGFEALLETHPHTALSLTRILARWLRQGHQKGDHARRVATVTILPGTPDVDAGGLARALAGSLEPHGSALVLEPDVVDERVEEGVAESEEGSQEHHRVTEWLSLQELEHRFLIYVADAEPGAWSRRCLRQSDAVLTVVRADRRPELGPLARKAATGDAAGAGGRNELVLLQDPSADAPDGTGRWLDLGDFSEHHHLRRKSPDHVDRLARHLAGRAVGVVLGGGGARGFAHVGVIRALREAGLHIDRFGGASMGSIVAGMFAAGRDSWTVEETLQWAWDRSGNKPHQNLTFPAYSLVTGSQVRRMLEWVFGDLRIEDLWTPFFCTTTNLTRGTSMVHRRGSVVRWIEASVAIPGIVPPCVTDDGELLADGALLKSLPTDVMLDEAHGPVVAVSVSSDAELRVEGGRIRAPSGWEAVRGKLLPFREPPSFPSIFRILHRSAVIGSIQSERNVGGDVDLYLEPPLSGFDMFDWTSLGQIVDAGYRYAAEELERQPELVELLTAPAAELDEGTAGAAGRPRRGGVPGGEARSGDGGARSSGGDAPSGSGASRPSPKPDDAESAPTEKETS